MNIESVREYCLSLPLVTEAFPFDERTLVFRILGKIFACVDLERPEWVTMKCNADYALELREEHPEIEGAWHWNKIAWKRLLRFGAPLFQDASRLLRSMASMRGFLPMKSMNCRMGGTA